MDKALDAFWNHIAANPALVMTYLMFVCYVFSVAFIWFWMIWYRKEALHGLKGKNLFWEGSEQIVFWVLFMLPPIVFKAVFISEIPPGIYWWIFGSTGFVALGVKAFDYGLAFLGKDPVGTQHTQGAAKVITTTEVLPGNESTKEEAS